MNAITMLMNSFMRYCDHLGGDECKKWRQSWAEQSRAEGNRKKERPKKYLGSGLTRSRRSNNKEQPKLEKEERMKKIRKIKQNNNNKKNKEKKEKQKEKSKEWNQKREEENTTAAATTTTAKKNDSFFSIISLFQWPIAAPPLFIGNLGFIWTILLARSPSINKPISQVNIYG